MQHVEIDRRFDLYECCARDPHTRRTVKCPVGLDAHPGQQSPHQRSIIDLGSWLIVPEDAPGSITRIFDRGWCLGRVTGYADMPSFTEIDYRYRETQAHVAHIRAHGQVHTQHIRHNASIISNFVRMLLEGVTRLLLVNLL